MSDLALRKERIEELQNLASNGNEPHDKHLLKKIRPDILNTRFSPNKVGVPFVSLILNFLKIDSSP